MTEKEKKKQVAKISVFITSIFVIFLSISYAFINQTLVGTKKQVITAGNLQLNLTEVDSVTLENALPMYDEVGMTQKPFTFSLENTTATPTNYVLKLVDVTPAGRDKLDTVIVKYGLEKNGEKTIQKLFNLTNNVLDQGKIEGNETIDYTLRLWIDSSVEDESLIKNKTLSYRIQIEASQEIEVSYKGMMKRAYSVSLSSSNGARCNSSDERGFCPYIGYINTIVFENEINVPEGISEDKKWDLSVLNDGSVMGYLEENRPDDLGKYKLHIQGNKKIYANIDSSYMFQNFCNLESIEGMENLDTSQTTNMSSMFSSYSSSQPLDLSSFDTSNVTNMSSMFSGYSSNQPLDLSPLDTSNVTNMSSMFSSYSSNQPLDLSPLDTSNVTIMYSMLSYYSGGSLIIDNWDTSNVTNTNNMFSSYSSNQPLDLSHFDTSNATYMTGMFSNWGSDASLDISNFDFSKVTHKESIFVRNYSFYASPILVKDEATRAWVLEQNPNLTGVTIKNQ